jgi:hypothetical protein
LFVPGASGGGATVAPAWPTEVSSSASVSPKADVSFASASSIFSSSTGETGDEAREERGATAAAPAPAAPAADAAGAASDVAGIVFPAALGTPSASFVEGGSVDIMSFAGLRALRVFFLGRLCGGMRIRWRRGRK